MEAYTKLTEVLEFDGYSVPHVDELVRRLGRAWFFDTFDLTKGYWQDPLSPTCDPKTAFSTSCGPWHYQVLPFTLHGALATFQRLMAVDPTLLPTSMTYLSTP